MIEKLKKLIGKKVFLEISGGRIYNGYITDVDETHIFMIDKFNKELFIAISEIKFIQEKSR